MFEQALSKSGSVISENMLKQVEDVTGDTTQCYLCHDLLKLTDQLADIIEPELKTIEFQTFLIGTTLTKEFWERERSLKEEFDVIQRIIT